MDNKIIMASKYDSKYNKSNQQKPNTLRVRYSKYLRDLNRKNKNKTSKPDVPTLIFELEFEKAELENIIHVLEFKNKVLEENCSFLKEKNIYFERRLRDLEINDKGDNSDDPRTQKSSSDEDEETEQNNTTGKITFLKERISGAIFGVALPNLTKIFRKIKEKKGEIKEFIEEQGGLCDGEEMAEGGMKCPLQKVNFHEKIAALKVNLYRVVIVLSTLMVVSGVGYAGYKIWKNRFRHPAYLVPSEDDEEDSGDELFRAPGTSRGVENMAKSHSTDSFETPGISTDFKSILDTANNK